MDGCLGPQEDLCWRRGLEGGGTWGRRERRRGGREGQNTGSILWLRCNGGANERRNLGGGWGAGAKGWFGSLNGRHILHSNCLCVLLRCVGGQALHAVMQLELILLETSF